MFLFVLWGEVKSQHLVAIMALSFLSQETLGQISSLSHLSFLICKMR